MKTTLAALVAILLGAGSSPAATTDFFDASQGIAAAGSGPTSETLRSRDYLFVHSLDKFWYPTISIGPGEPTGRFEAITWPAGLHAQAVTAGPSGLIDPQGSAAVTIRRVDGAVFDLVAFRVRLLANTAGAGGAFEIMPLLNGNDGFANPLVLDATGYAGNTFSYATPSLSGFDTYQITLWADFAIIGATVHDATPTPPALRVTRAPSSAVRLSWPSDAPGFVPEATDAPVGAPWTPVAGTPRLVAGEWLLDVPADAASRCFRLRFP